MADNVTVTNKKTSFNADTNADIPVATKDIGGYQFQKVLLYDENGDPLVQTFAAQQGDPPPGYGIQLGVYDYGSGDFNILASNTPGTIPISHESECPSRVVSGTTTSGTLTAAGQTVSISPAFNYGIVQFAFYGTYSAATLIFEYTVDGSTYESIPVTAINDGTVASTVTLTNKTALYRTFIGGYTARVRCTAISSGTVNVRLRNFGGESISSPSVYQAGSWTVTSSLPTASTSTTSSVSGSASSVQLLASNSSRKSASIYNDSSASLYVKFGTTASTTDFKYPLGPRDILEFPAPIYTGRVDGIWSSASGAARIAEET